MLAGSRKEVDAPELPPTIEDYRHVRAFAVASGILLAGVIAMWLLIPSPQASRVNVRWAAGTTEATRSALEQEFGLVAGEWRVGTTWIYDLVDPSPANISVLIRHPAVEDTHHIDRSTATIAADAPRGTHVMNEAGLSAWHESDVFEWVGLSAFSSVLVSVMWLVTAGRQVPRRE